MLVRGSVGSGTLPQLVGNQVRHEAKVLDFDSHHSEQSILKNQLVAALAGYVPTADGPAAFSA